jgi:hypothetical protein
MALSSRAGSTDAHGGREPSDRRPLERLQVLRTALAVGGDQCRGIAPCAADLRPGRAGRTQGTRKSTEEGLQQEFNSLDAQREAAEAYITSQKHESWQVIPYPYDDGGYTGGDHMTTGFSTARSSC